MTSGYSAAQCAKSDEARRRMSQPRDPDDDEGDRSTANIILAVGFVVLVGGGIWLANAMIDARKADECISSGRRNCTPIDTPSRYGSQP
jgi:hypothetical protein